MALKDLIELSSTRTSEKIGISEERFRPLIPVMRQYIAFWRWYPDIFVDFLQTGGNPDAPKKLNFYFYQRVFLRVAIRYKYVYAVYPRGYSKSFISVLALMVLAVLYPGAKLFSAAGGKSQSAGILQEKVKEICDLVPAFNKEIDRDRGKTKESKDYCYYLFRNGSFIDNLVATEKSRGKRRNAGILEECVGINGDILQQVLIPTMSIARILPDGTQQQDEPLNQSQIYITTAGYKGTFAYQKLIQTLVQSIIEPDKAYIMGGTYRVPILAGLYSKSFVQDQKRDGLFNEAAFGREYESIWSGAVEDAFFDREHFDRNRILNAPEYKASGRASRLAYYVIAVDVGRLACQTAALVFKVTPQAEGRAIVALVNIFTWDGTHFEDQAIALKRLYFDFNPRSMIIDGNGLGVGLLDYMVKPQIDSLGNVLPGFGVVNDDKNYYKKFKTDTTETDAIYVMKANPTIDTEAFSAVRVNLDSGRLKFLIDDKVAKQKLLATAKGAKMTPEEREEVLRPFIYTTMLKEEMLNLREENEGVNIKLKQANKKVHKDKFSALAYGMYYIKLEEDARKKKKKRNFAQYLFMN